MYSANGEKFSPLNLYIYKRQTLKTEFDEVNANTAGFYHACDVYIEAFYGPTIYRHIGPDVWGLGSWQNQLFGLIYGQFEPLFGRFFKP